jgi:anti-anti-sigma factor
MPITRHDVEILRLAQEPAFSERIEPLLTRIREPGWNRHVIVSLAEVSYLSSSNLTQLLKLRQFARVLDLQMRIAGCSDQVMSEFRVTGLDRVFDFSPDEASAY